MHYLRYTLILLFFTACSSRESETPHSFRVYEEDGVTISVTTGGPKYSGPLFTYEEHVRIHEDEARVESLLVLPHWMGIDEDGMLYVIDVTPGTGIPRIVVYDESGEFRNLVGHTGQGPGEYVDPRILALDEGVITVFDRTLNRLSYFTRDGSLLSLITFTPWQDGPPARAYIGPNGIQIAIHETALGGGWSSRKATVRTAQGEVLAHLETGKFRAGQSVRVVTGRYSAESPLNGMAAIKYVPERGLLVTSGEEPMVEWLNLKGDLAATYNLGLRKERVTKEDLAMVRQFFEKRYLTGSELGQRLMKAWQEQVDIPEERGFWISAHVDESGFIWLEDPRSVFNPSERSFLIVSPSGEYLGMCALPQGRGAVSRGYYPVITYDPEAGTYTPIVYRLQPAVDGLYYPWQ